jgi:serine/threonine protein kinase
MNGPKKTCAKCGTELAEDARGLCPRCLLLAGFESEPDPEATVAAGRSGATRAQPRLGDTFGPYRILRQLGQGGMGVVFEAEEQETGRRVALKVIGRQFDSLRDRTRFLREGRLAASINHPNSVYVFGTDEIGGTPTISMELVAGGTLSDRVKNTGPMPIPAAVDAILQIIAGLEAAQAIGILHRDVKPGNCFEDADGTVKIGDFGLSISTAARAEATVTAPGTMVGTPAFCSPEQLRGDELNARSDMYSVGGTLFYLLTGRVPFEGHNLAQLTANVLEKPTPSPRDFRKEIPKGLANVVVRCLAKQPADRFKSYDDLRQALAPYASASPTPATLSLRFLAGVLDMLVFSAIGILVWYPWCGNVTDYLDLMSKRSPAAFAVIFASFLLGLMYYSLSEGFWGATLGKALCRLRVVRPDKNPPGFPRALLRALFYVVLPGVPYWIVCGRDPMALMRGSMLTQQLVGFSFYFVLALLFSTVRRRNGFAAVHDLITGTRVISRAALATRPLLTVSESQPPAVETSPTVGPYHVLETLETAAAGQWLLGYDLRLLRKVWIHSLPVGAPNVPAKLRSLSRIGRLRWISGRRSPEENWDAFEGISGKSLPQLIKAPQPWKQVRFWIYDLARELTAAEKDGTLPPVLALDRVWITADGRAKLLDFPAPGSGAADSRTADSPSPSLATPEPDSAQHFLSHVAVAALKGCRDTAVEAASKIAIRLPLHARDFLKKLPTLPSADAVANTLKPLLHRVTIVSRLRRAAVVAGCAALPVMIAVILTLSMSMLQEWRKDNPGVMELSSLLQQRQGMRWVMNEQDRTKFDRHAAIFIASHYRAAITNETTWNGVFAMSMIRDEARQFAEQSIADHPSPTEQEITEADEAIGPNLVNSEAFEPRFFTMLIVLSVVYVFVPTVLAALLFRGGLILRVASVTFVRRDGAPASRLRIFWRTLVAWSPLMLLFVLLGPIHFLHRLGYPALGESFLLALFAGLALLSVMLPNRGLPDRFAGTWPVAR